MEPFAIAIIGAVVFGVVVTLAVFIRHLILSRDKSLNDKAHMRALREEHVALEQMRAEFSAKRFDAHYEVLGKNRDAIEYLDNKIHEILNKKLQLIEKYSNVSLEASASILEGSLSENRKNVCDLLRHEIDAEIKMYDEEIKKLQVERAKRWDAHSDLQKSLIEEEAKRNAMLDKLYVRHTTILEELFIRHNDNIDNIAEKNIESSSKDMSFLLAPLQFLLKLFKLQFSNPNVDTKVFTEELNSRKQVLELEKSILEANSTSERIDDDLSNDEAAVDLIT